MDLPAQLTTTVSTDGQVTLPEVVRDHKGWSPGVQLCVEETKDGVLLRRFPAREAARSEPLFPPTRLEDVFGMFHRPGRPALTIEEMDAAIDAEARDRACD